ncbi:hypothetical protein PoB_007523500 [Plakobranchus ocellatus]|uniref:Secreted protein n=1 Tax=Plakobranchus ocellatus TaxID=259542 RepID=A0AAV4DX32_9GAST|nr:hypothetical protein PoB_007523500 [Plakobranchus ocellatus]
MAPILNSVVSYLILLPLTRQTVVLVDARFRHALSDWSRLSVWSRRIKVCLVLLWCISSGHCRRQESYCPETRLTKVLLYFRHFEPPLLLVRLFNKRFLL